MGQFEQYYPSDLKEGKIKKYIEPFVGGGAVFFDIIQKYEINSAYLYDINDELLIVYQVIQKNPEIIVEYLERLSKQYKCLSEDERKDFFYKVRTNYNLQRFQINYNKYSENWIPRAAQLIFLNKTCFNGLFRLNRQGEFNVPFGKYRNPKILDEENIFNVYKILQKAEIRNGDFEDCEELVDERTFVYFDPPYRPISQTSSFTSYSKFDFGDGEQVRLGSYFTKLDKKYGAKLMLSNSDPTNNNPDDKFFINLFSNFQIHKVSANRMINCNGAKRGHVNELLITNYRNKIIWVE